MIPHHVEQEIKDRADIVDVVREFLPLRRVGSAYRTLCPFHDERTASFYVTPSKGIFKCFGCDKGGDSIHFLMEHEGLSYPDALAWLARHYNIPIEENYKYIPSPPRSTNQRPVKPKLSPSFVDLDIFQKSQAGYETNNLVQWLCQKLGRTVVMEAVRDYHIGTAKNGKTIFWQLNIEGKASTGHVIAYPLNNHHRNKEVHPTWVHSLLKLTDETKYNWIKYWFGEHLLAKYSDRKVAIVESEKTALVASIYLADLGFIWLASCGLHGLNDPHKWKVLHGRTIVLYPDLSPPDDRGLTPFQYWTGIAAEMRKSGYDVSVNNFLETCADEFERSQKWDLGDFLLRRSLSDFGTREAAHPGKNYPEPVARLVHKNPAVAELIELFDLEFEGLTPLPINAERRENVLP